MRVDLDQRRRDEGAVRGSRPAAAAGDDALRPPRASRSMCACRCCARLGVDHRADVGRQPVRIADAQLAPSRPCSIVEHRGRRCPPAGTARAAPSSAGRRCRRPRPARRAPPARAAPSESTIIAFWPPVSAISGPAGRPRRALGERAVDQLRDLGRAGEHHAARRADRRPARRRPSRRRPGSSCSAAARHAGLVQQAHGAAAISGVCSAGLASTALPAASAARDLAGEDRQRKVPRADADDRAQRPVRVVVELAARPAPRSSAGSRPPRAPRRRRSAASCRPRARPAPISVGMLAPPAGRRRARGSAARSAGGVAAQAGAAAAARAERGVDLVGVGLDAPCRRRRDGRPDCGSRGAPAPVARSRQRSAAARPRRARARGSAAASAAQRVLVRQVEARRIAALVAEQLARQRDAPDAARRPAAPRATCDRIGDQLVDRHRSDRRCG